MSGKRGAAYVRAATWESAQEKLAEQEQNIREWADLNGFDVVEVYADLGPGNGEARPGLQRLLEDARAGLYEAVIVVDMARLFRTLALLIQHLEMMCQQLAVDVIATDQDGGDA